MFIKILSSLLFSMVYGIEIKHMDCEHPKLTFLDPEYFSNVSMKATRLSRSDNTHYFDFNATLLKQLDKDVTMAILFQQQNTILPSANLLELHYQLCDAINENNLITKQFREAFYRIPKEIRPMTDFKCPLKVGSYCYTKMGMPAFVLPNSFPVMDGRVTISVLHENHLIIKVYGIFHVK